MKVEDGLAGRGADVDHNPVVLEPRPPRRVRDEVEHPLRLARLELPDVAERLDVARGEHEQVRVGPRVDVADRDEPVRCVDVISLPDERAEETVCGGVRQRGSRPR